jgi:rare lipoprotein A
MNDKKALMLALFIMLCLVVVYALAGNTPPANTDDSDLAGHTESGKASFYGMEFQSRETANGEIFKQSAKTAAHKTLPFDTKVKVTNPETKESVVVRINDRGPFVEGRVIDLSQSAFKAIADIDDGVVPVEIEVVE